MAIRVTARDLKHIVMLCTSNDVVTDDGKLILIRENVVTTWMKIEVKAASSFSRAGYNLDENTNKQTHIATMRFRRDFDISTAAWIYEERLQSGARWFKIIGVKEEDGKFMVLALHLVERGDNLVEPVAEDAATEMPSIKTVNHGVVL